MEKGFEAHMKAFAERYKEEKENKVDAILQHLQARIEGSTNVVTLLNTAAHIEVTKMVLQKEIERFTGYVTAEALEDMKEDVATLAAKLDKLQEIARKKSNIAEFDELLDEMRKTKILDAKADELLKEVQGGLRDEDKTLIYQIIKEHKQQEKAQKQKEQKEKEKENEDEDEEPKSKKKGEPEIAHAVELIKKLDKIKADLCAALEDTRILIPDMDELECTFARMKGMIDDFEQLLELKVKIIKNLQNNKKG